MRVIPAPRRLFPLVLAFAMAPEMAVGATYSIAGLSDTAVVQGLAAPTDFDWLPDGRMLVVEKGGIVRIVVGGAVTPALDWTANVNAVSERGLLGVCVDPAFSTNGFVYLYYTTTTPINRISRFHMVGNALDPSSEFVVLDNIDSTNGNHNGGTILIGPDGKLWAAPGDSGTGGAKSQDIATGRFNGKVLRMNLDGSAPPDNPFFSVPGLEPRIWAFGFRNPFRFSFRPAPNNALFVADVGEAKREELDALATPASTPPGTGGGNYGWPCREGFLPTPILPSNCRPSLLDPIFDYDRTVGNTIIGGVFVTSPAYPAAIQGKYLFGDNAQSWIRTLDINASNQVTGALQDVATAAAGPVAFRTGPDGLVYYAAIITGRIYRIDPPSPLPPTVTSFLATPSVLASPGASRLTWTTQNSPTVTVSGVAGTFGASGAAVVPVGTTTSFLLTATNPAGTATARVTVNVLPTPGAGLGAPAITTPMSGEVLGVAGVTVSWDPMAGATGYGIHLWNAGTGETLFTGLAGNGSTSTLLTLQQTNGSYMVGVRACGGGAFTDAACGMYATRSFGVNLISPTGAPTVTFPGNGSTLTASTQVLSWTAVAKANPSLTLSYEVLLTDIAGGSKPELQIMVPEPGLSTIYSLHSSSQYELKVRACQAGCGPFSAPVTFAVSLPPVPTGTPGITGCSVSGGNSLTCDWNAVAGADLYQVYVVQPPPAGPGGGALTVAARVVSATTVTLPVPSGVANVIVAACNGDGCGPFSSPMGIGPAGPNPNVASLGTPLGGSVVSGPTVMFSWNRVPGDNGSNTIYRLFVQDLSRQATALDVYTTQNFWAAFFKAEGTRYDALVIANPGPGQVAGPAQGFDVSGTSASAPTMVAPGHQSSVKTGNVQMGWSPVLGAGLYQYFIAAHVGGGVATGVAPGLAVQVPLAAVGGAATPYSGIARACPSGLACTAGSDAGWGPWSNAPGGPGVTNFTVTP
jgi:glucose/arabinose dehydrogenase